MVAVSSTVVSTARREPQENAAFHYVSPCSDLLGWVIERATGRRFHELFSELVWQRIGAEHDAYVTVDGLGAPRAAGGICVTLRDLLSPELSVCLGLRAVDGATVPEASIDEDRHASRPEHDIDLAAAAGHDAAMKPKPESQPVKLRSQMLLGLGIRTPRSEHPCPRAFG